ncbi:MAG: DJ-1/PfpI family protein [Alphaproteobacteria bacterium]|nr:DJ-1/PfpI family protein [Alphaproteobacteria bacterium]
MEPRRVLLLAFDGVQALDLVGPHQMFCGANEALGAPAYDVRIIAEQDPVIASSGLRVHADGRIDDLAWAPRDTVLALGGSDEGLRDALRRRLIVPALRATPGKVERIASVCAGAFLLAEAGLLDGRRATTHWAAAATLARAYPRVTVDVDALYVRDGDVWTSAGVTAGIDLALAMIEVDHGRAVALSVARRHVVFRKRPGGQSQFAAPDAGDDISDPRLRRLACAIGDRPGSDWSVAAMADVAGVSVRTLTRTFAREGGDSPARFVERVRVERARAALCEDAAPINAVARAAGFPSVRALERAFHKRLGVSPSAFRERFGTRSL